MEVLQAALSSIVTRVASRSDTPDAAVVASKSRDVCTMHVAHHGYLAVGVLLAVSAIALAVPGNSRRLSTATTILLVAAFLHLLRTMLYGG
jgi:hypothetical protein